MSIWQELQYFKRKENWGDPNKVDPKLLYLIDAYRKEIDIPHYVSSCVKYNDEYSAHYPNQYGHSEAVDLFPLLAGQHHITLCDCLLVATRYPFSGIGVYPYWRYTRRGANGDIMEIGGIHLDISTRRVMRPYRSTGQWIGIPTHGGAKLYLPLTKWELKKHGII